MKRIVFATMLLLPIAGQSQLHLTVFGGATGYQGDLQSKRFTVNESHLGIGIGLKYDVNPHLAVRTGLVYGKIAGSDAKNEPILQARNLSFQSRIFEGNLLMEYALFNLSKRRFTPYLFAGVALFRHNPFAFDTLGTKIFLRPLSTEGQGLTQYPASKKYGLTQLAIPFGGGLRMKLADNITLGYEIGLRKTFFDHLDDVSGTYVDQAILLQERGPRAVQMAFRGDELKNSTAQYPPVGSIRGGAQFKDWYYFHGISVTVALQGSRDLKRGAVDCPKKL